jgi:hypothetical protein
MSYQTIRLSRGRHTSAEHGACVMELASMLAGDSFTDHPSSVCPVIGAFVRAYNDRVDDTRRQDLYRYAAELVGSTGPASVRQARADRLTAWAQERWGSRWTRRFLPAAWRLVGVERQPSEDVLGTHAVRAIWRINDASHAAVLSLVDELLLIGAKADVAAPSAGPGRRQPTAATSARTV